MTALVILPSYNESENITSLINEIINLKSNYYVCIVDDNSPDGTQYRIKEFYDQLSFEKKKRIHLIVRGKKDGRGSAVRTGIEWGLTNATKFEFFMEMDCDFSHAPSDIEKGIKLLEKADVVIGARYPHGEIVGWPINRKIFSFLSNLLIRTFLNWNIHDYTNGFRFYTRESAEKMCIFSQRNKGYIYLSETLSYFIKEHFIIESFPIIFTNRKKGRSNTSIKEICSSICGIVSIFLRYRYGNSD